MTELEKKIAYYAEEYYKGNELISDSEYDLLIAQLRSEQPDSKLLDTVVGDDFTATTDKIKLPVTMGTLFKCNSENELIEWIDKHGTKDYTLQHKIDGAGILLEYKDGVFVKAYSRGNSMYAEDTTKNMSLVNGVVKNLKDKFSGHIRGECVMYNSVFEKEFKNAGYKTARNTCAGIIKRLDGKDCDKLNFIAYDVFDADEKVDNTEMSKIEFLKNNGFDTPPVKFLSASSDIKKEVIAERNAIAKIRDTLEYPIDGIVLKQNNTSKEDLMRKTPVNNCAIKFDLTGVVTVIKDIEWSLSGRYFSPVAIVEPVMIDGREIKRASVYNVNKMEEMGIQIGSKVELITSGEIIPKIRSVIK